MGKAATKTQQNAEETTFCPSLPGNLLHIFSSLVGVDLAQVWVAVGTSATATITTIVHVALLASPITQVLIGHCASARHVTTSLTSSTTTT